MCAPRRRNHSLCIRCLDEKKLAIDKADCDYSEQARFCVPKQPNCTRVLEAECGNERT